MKNPFLPPCGSESHLALGAAVTIVAGWVFTLIAVDVTAGAPSGLDILVATWFHQHTTPALVRVATITTVLGSPLLLGEVSALFGLLLAWRRSWDRLLRLALTMGGVWC